MPLRALILSLVLAGLAAAPANAADVVLRTFDETDVGSIDAYGDRVAWTETGDSESGALMTLEGSEAVAVDVKPVRHLDLAAGPDGKPVAVYDRCKAGRCALRSGLVTCRGRPSSWHDAVIGIVTAAISWPAGDARVHAPSSVCPSRSALAVAGATLDQPAGTTGARRS